MVEELRGSRRRGPVGAQELFFLRLLRNSKHQLHDESSVQCSGRPCQRRLRAPMLRARVFLRVAFVLTVLAVFTVLTNRMGGACAAPPGTEYDNTTIPLAGSVF